MAQDMEAPESPGIWQRIKNGVSAVVGGIVSSVVWTGAFMGLSFLLPEKYDFLGVKDEVKGKDTKEAATALGKKALPLLAVSAAINGVMGLAGFGVAPQQPTGQLTAPNLPRNNAQQGQNGRE